MSLLDVHRVGIVRVLVWQFLTGCLIMSLPQMIMLLARATTSQHRKDIDLSWMMLPHKYVIL